MVEEDLFQLRTEEENRDGGGGDVLEKLNHRLINRTFDVYFFYFLC